jgi:LPXTG-motif cell wall-anchored protein
VKLGYVVEYTLHLETPGPKRFHDVTMTDWVPDNNPGDVTSTGTATLVPDSAVCLGEFETVCSVTVGPDGLITWDIGDLQTDSVDVEFVVRFPDLPDEVTYDENDEFRVLLWNQAYVAWREVVGEQPGTEGGYVYQDLTASSNEVVVEAVANKPGEPVEPPPPVSPPENPPANPPAEPVLPATGAPAHLAQLALLGGLALALGVALAARGRRKVAPRHAARVQPRHLAR